MVTWQGIFSKKEMQQNLEERPKHKALQNSVASYGQESVD